MISYIQKRKISQFFARIKRQSVFFKIGIIISLLILCCSVLMIQIEGSTANPNKISNFSDAIWWAIVTITTVGYGDIVPHTTYGRILGTLLILIGFSLFSLFTGLMASIMIEDKMKGAQGLKPIKNKKHIIICGWNNTAKTMLKAINEQEAFHLVLVIIGTFKVDIFQEIQLQFPMLNTKFVRGDASQQETLKRANIQNASQVYIFPSENTPRESADDRSFIIANSVRFISKTIPISVHLFNSANKDLLQRINVNNLVSADEVSGYMMANNALNEQYLSFILNLLHNDDNKVDIKLIPSNFVGKTFKELLNHFLLEYNSIMIGTITINPQLSVSDIFSDDSSAIDNFIKHTLENKKTQLKSHNNSVQLRPSNSYIIKEEDMAIILNES